MSDPTGSRERPISAEERTGVMYPNHLRRYSAGWIEPNHAVSAVVDQYWHVSWALDQDEALDQPIIDLPAVNVTFEDGDVAAPLVITGVHSRAWRRTIRGSGQVFAIRLRPAGLSVLSHLMPERIADETVPLTAELDERLHALMSTIAQSSDPAEQARSADRLIAQVLTKRAPSPMGLLANDVLDELSERSHHRTGMALADRLGHSERTIQRACVETLGHGPKWLSRRIRLQEVALALVSRPDADLAVIAGDLGYADQSHLTRDFRLATGVTPHAYRQAVSRLTSQQPRPE